jgi:hypothetical protein
VTFLEFLKTRKKIDITEKDLQELMEEHYEEYREFLMKIKDGCGGQ